MTIEHLILKSIGGTKHYGNVCLTFKKCNQNRGNEFNHDGAISEILQRLTNHVWFCKDIFNVKICESKYEKLEINPEYIDINTNIFLMIMMKAVKN